MRKSRNAKDNPLRSVAIFPALDRITLNNNQFNAWRNIIPEYLEKLIEKFNQRVNASGRISNKNFSFNWYSASEKVLGGSIISSTLAKFYILEKFVYSVVFL